MSTGKQIKIIKRAERAEPPTAPAEKKSPVTGDTGATARRDAAAVVTEWVSELRRKKVAEATLGFEGLFRKAA